MMRDRTKLSTEMSAATPKLYSLMTGFQRRLKPSINKIRPPVVLVR